ncbi:hypothetical protein PCANC_14910 [Puccinia coronata f. sp. avenae]|uniref:Uncharacterized protein n=1 Tax=Puccinia coronata f. sp. avenae TaxID=200324 RepID=A0A2N5UKF1_9BASI|nr:hypothetical protein PCANC_14910 [Puccinia coronata f. sp. avenae]
MELQQATAQTSTVPNASSGKKKKAAKVQAPLPQVTVTPPAGNKYMPNSASKKTPVKQRARLVTPASTKKSPLQMTKKDHPEGFEHTKVLWGLVAKGAIPSPPSEEQLLGLTAWVPNLDKQADSLYNVAHKMATIKTFRECVAGGAYAYMNVNASEQGDQERHDCEEKRKVLQTAREQLCKRRFKFLVNHNFPKRYLDIIKPVQAHSDDEYFPDRDVYVVKKLPFRSNTANVFFRRLDEVIRQFKLEDGKRRAPTRHCVQVRNPAKKIFPKAPKGMPLDFYNVKWFNNKLPAQRQNLANLNTVAFLENPLNSLWFKGALEKVGNQRFTKKRWDSASKDYNLDFLVEAEVETESNEDEDSNYGGSIDLGSSDSSKTSDIDNDGGGDNPVPKEAKAKEH